VDARTNQLRVLITVPDIAVMGGVAQYIYSIKDSFSVQASLYTIGHRKGDAGVYADFMRLLNDIMDYRHQLKSEKFDLVHLNPSLDPKALIRESIMIALAKWYKLPVLVFFHGWQIKTQRRLKGVLLNLFQWIYFKADAVVVLASPFKKAIIGWGYEGPVFVETTVVDEKLLRDIPISRVNGGKHISSGEATILFLARMVKEKGVYIVIETFKVLIVKYPKLKLILAGAGEELDSARKYVEKQGIAGVSFTGFVEGTNKIQTLINSDIYLFPSYWGEGVPISLLEAMAFGLPIVTSDAGGIPDFFEDGKMGYLVRGKDPQSYAESIEHLILNGDLCQKISCFNYEYSRGHFLPANAVKRLEQIYREIAFPK